MKCFEAVDILAELVSVPSVNPAHTDDPSISGERRLAETLFSHLERRGMATEIKDNYQPDRPSVVASVGPCEGPSLLFEVHLDTVGVDNMIRPPFNPVIENGRLYGRGACDMKGATASLLAALTPERVKSVARKGIRLMVVGAPDEECGTLGAVTLARGGLRADRAIVLEPTRCRPVVAHKASCLYEVFLRGRAGHGSRPESGVSTNAALARLLPELFSAHDHLRNMFSHPLLGSSSLNIGRVEGGQAFNIIPDATRIHLDRRVIPNEDPSLFEEALHQLLDMLVRDGALVSAECHRVNHAPAFSTSPDAPLVRSLTESIRAVTGETPSPEGTAWVSDASALAANCPEILVFGPGDIAQAHTADEYIELSELERATAIFSHFLDSL